MHGSDAQEIENNLRICGQGWRGHVPDQIIHVYWYLVLLIPGSKPNKGTKLLSFNAKFKRPSLSFPWKAASCILPELEKKGARS